MNRSPAADGTCGQLTDRSAARSSRAVNSSLLTDLRARGVVLEGGARLRVSCASMILDELLPVLKAHRDGLLDALRDEAQDTIAKWPLAYRRWLGRPRPLGG